MALSKWEVLNLRVGWNKIGLANQHSLNAKKSKKIVTEKKIKILSRSIVFLLLQSWWFSDESAWWRINLNHFINFAMLKCLNKFLYLIIHSKRNLLQSYYYHDSVGENEKCQRKLCQRKCQELKPIKFLKSFENGNSENFLDLWNDSEMSSSSRNYDRLRDERKLNGRSRRSPSSSRRRRSSSRRREKVRI